MERQKPEPVPRLLNVATAAAYLGLSSRGFEQQWRAGKLPAPHRLGRRLLWDRKLLDSHVDKLSGITKATIDEDW